MFFLKGSVALVVLTGWSASFAGSVSPQLEEVVRQNPTGSLDVVCYVRAEPAFRVAAEIKAVYAPRLRYFGNEAKALARIALLRQLTLAESIERSRALKTIEDMLNERGRRIGNALVSSASASLASVRNLIESYGGIASDQSPVLPSVRAQVPARRIYELAANPNVTYIDLYKVGSPLLDNQTVSLGLESIGGFWNNGVTGGLFDVGLLDTGVQRNHPAFTGFNWEGVTTDPDGHGTGVTGMLCSKDSTYHGMAYGLHTVCAADANTGMYVATDWLLMQTVQLPEAINVSWGSTQPDPNDYRDIEAYYDSAADAFGITFGQAAGNEGDSGYGSLIWPAKAYNTIAVANIWDQNTTTRSDDEIWHTSSRGPTPAGRKKPDISAPGNETYSTTNTLGFGNLGGTSSATPKVTGAAILLRDAGTIGSLEDKAVLINSADTWSDANTLDPADDGPLLGSHWDRSYGWGYLDLLTAYQQAPYVITGNFTRPIIVGSKKTAYYSGSRSTGFKASLVWNRHVGPYTGDPPVTYESLTNFNLGLYSGTNGSLLSQSTSTIDNVEQVSSQTTGSSVLKVQTIGSWDSEVNEEDFALAVPGLYVRRDPPSFGITFDAVEYAVVGSEISLSATVENTGELPVYNVLASVNAVVVQGNNPMQLGTLSPGESVQVHWDVQVNQSSGPQTIRLSVQGSGYDETFSSFSDEVVNVIPFYLAPTSFTLVRGTITSGNLSSVTTSDGIPLSIQPGITISSSQWPVELKFLGTSPLTSPTYFYVRVESNGSSTSLHQKVEVYNYVTSQWQQLMEAPLTTSYRTFILAPTVPLSQYIKVGNREVQIRLSAKAFGPVLAFPWRYRIDQVGWHIGN